MHHNSLGQDTQKGNDVKLMAFNTPRVHFPSLHCIRNTSTQSL